MSVPYFEDEIRSAITSDATLSALVPASQVFPCFVRSDVVYPCISITCVGSSRQRNFDDSESIMKRIQIDSFAPTFPAVKALEIGLCNLFDGFRGYLVTGSVFRVIECVAEAILDNWNQDSSVFRVMTTFEFTYT